MSRYGQIVIGPPGAGKTTYCFGLQQFFTALERPIAIVNLDPACSNPKYTADISISDLITLEDVMRNLKLGPNGGMLYCLEYLEANFDWLQDQLDRLTSDYVVFDLPGQVELSTDHMSLRNVISRLQKLDYRLAAVNLTDSQHITDASKYVSMLLMSLRVMLQLELPHVNILSKIDLLSTFGDLPMNLEFYTDVQDLSYLIGQLNEDTTSAHGKKMAQLNEAICEMVEDFNLVGFETLCVEDKESMYNVTKVIDKAIGYAAPHERSEKADTVDFSQLLNPLDNIAASKALNIQDRWLDSKAEYDQAEIESWARESELVHDAHGQLHEFSRP